MKKILTFLFLVTLIMALYISNYQEEIYAVQYGGNISIQTIVCEPWSSWEVVSEYCSTSTSDLRVIDNARCPRFVQLLRRTRECKQLETGETYIEEQRYERYSGCCTPCFTIENNEG